MVLKKIVYGYIPMRKAKTKRIQKKWNKKYGVCIGPKYVTTLPVPPAKEAVYNSFKDIVPSDPQDEFWVAYGSLMEDGEWHWYGDLPLYPLEALIEAQKRLLAQES